MDKRARYPFGDIEAKWRPLLGRDAGASRGAVGESPAAPASASSERLLAWLGSAADAEGEGGLSLARQVVTVDALASFWAARGRRWACPGVVETFASPRSLAGKRAEPVPAAALRGQAANHLGKIRALGSALGLRHGGELISTADPRYYRYTQWLFLQLFLYGVVTRDEARQEHCQRCGKLYPLGALATCKACGGDLAPRPVFQWNLDVTPFGDRLIQDLEKAGLPEAESANERDLLGRTRGFEVSFPASRIFAEEYFEILAFTTTLERIYGVTFILLDPYHPLLDSLLDPACEDDVQRYRERLRRGVEPRISAARTGAFALNPVSLKRIPVLISPLASGANTHGVVLGVPAHDAELFELARRQKLAIREVIHNERAKFDSHLRLEEPWLGDGVLTNSGPYSTLPIKVARERILAALARRGVCQRGTRFRHSKIPLASATQWGPPIPIIQCKRCGLVPVPECELPLELPGELTTGTPSPPASAATVGSPRADTKDGGGPLSSCRAFLRVACPQCRETAIRDSHMILPWLGEAFSFLVAHWPEWSGRIEGFRDASAPAPATDPVTPVATAAEPVEAVSEPGDTFDSGDEGPGPEEAASDLDNVEAEAGDEDGDYEDGDEDGDENGKEAGDEGSDEDSSDEDGDAAALDEGLDDGLDDEIDDELEHNAPGLEQSDSEVSSSGPAPVTAVAKAPASAPGHKDLPRVGPRQPAGPAPAGTETERGRSDEPEDIAVAEEEEPDSPFERLSKLRPFATARWRPVPPVDVAILGPEAGSENLLQARFLCKFLHQAGHLPFNEPFAKVRHIARAMGTSETLERFGADATRLAILFAGPIDRPVKLDVWAVARMGKLLDRIWRQMTLRRERGKFVSRRMLVNKHFLIHDVTCRLAAWKPHTAVAALMRFVRFLEHPETAPEDMDRGAMRTFLILLYPFAPFLARELWSLMGDEHAIETTPWPVANDEILHPVEFEFPIYVQGRLVDRMTQPTHLEAEKLESRALARDRVRELVGTRKVERVVVVPRKLVSIVLGQK